MIGNTAPLKRLAACILGGLVLALMVGNQEGTPDDFGIAFREAIFRPRVLIFVGLGVIVFLIMTFRPLVVPYLTRPGIAPLTAGFLLVVVSQAVMNWYDPLADTNGEAKFGRVKTAVDKTTGLNPLTTAFYDYLAWTLLAVVLVGTAAAIVTRLRPVGYITAAVALFSAVESYLAHREVVNFDGRIDHSLGFYADVLGFLAFAAAAIVAVHAQSEQAETRAFATRLMAFRPGLPFVVVALIWGALAYFTAGWFGVGELRNDHFGDLYTTFSPTAASGLAIAYVQWLGYVLFALCIVGAGAASYLRNAMLAWVTGVVALVAILLTFLSVESMTATAAKVAPQYGAKWANVGVGGYVACMVYSLVVGAMALVVSSAPRAQPRAQKARRKGGPERDLPVSKMARAVTATSARRSLLIIGLGVALFYPPTLPVTWQNVLVGQIGVYVLLAIGLNVVVGWAGLLDLGYIAFYEIGSYTTAYFTGALPVKPPSWLTMTPLLTIPFAIVACLIAGVLLGAPTLRLRGDYLAIVTLGFGEIIQITAINLKNITGGPQGPTVAHPVFSFFGQLHVTFGQDNLPYWYLLLIMLAIVLVLFYRLEGSRIGRAWAAIREDEVAAQASGINTTRVKLLAFAIGASTSALAGSFFATQIGYFDPTLFTLQASILIVAYVVFGGMGSLVGAMAGAATLTWLPQFLKSQVPAPDRQMWIGALVLAMMIFRPAGLLPARRRKAELSGFEQPSTSEVTAVPVSEGL